MAKKRQDEWSRELIARLSTVTDAVASDVMYHVDCGRSLRRQKEITVSSINDNISLTMDQVFDFMENSDDCQFTIGEIMEQPQRHMLLEDNDDEENVDDPPSKDEMALSDDARDSDDNYNE